jgi:hypothetical protein
MLPRLTRASVLAAAALALTAAPAVAKTAKTTGVPVCNQASPHFQGGGLVALDPPVDSPAARYTTDLSPLPGKGQGLVNAASHSPALTVCGPGETTPATPAPDVPPATTPQTPGTTVPEPPAGDPVLLPPGDAPIGGGGLVY